MAHAAGSASRARGVRRVRRGAPALPRRRQDEHRPQPLAAGEHAVAHRVATTRRAVSAAGESASSAASTRSRRASSQSRSGRCGALTASGRRRGQPERRRRRLQLAALVEDLDAPLGLLELGMAEARQLHAALVELERCSSARSPSSSFLTIVSSSAIAASKSLMWDRCQCSDGITLYASCHGRGYVRDRSRDFALQFARVRASRARDRRRDAGGVADDGGPVARSSRPRSRAPSTASGLSVRAGRRSARESRRCAPLATARDAAASRRVGAAEPRPRIAGEPAARGRAPRAGDASALKRRVRARVSPVAHRRAQLVRQLGGVAAAHRDRAGNPRGRGGWSATCTRARRRCDAARAAARSRSVSRSMRRRIRPCAATTISAAADGVGARRSATKSAIVTSVSWPTAEITGTGHAGDGARDDLLVEGPEILDRSAAAPDDDDVDARHATDRAKRAAISAAAPSPCTRVGRITRCALGWRRREHLDDVAERRAVERRDDADLARQRGQRPFARRVEQPFGLQLLLQLLERQLQRAEAVRLAGARRRADTRPSARRRRAGRARRRAARRRA